MKKLIAISVVFALVAGAAFAQTANGISVNAWGRGVFAPLVFAGAETIDGKTVKDAKSSVYSGAGVTWGGPFPRVDFRINGNAEFIGFTYQMTEGGWTDGDNTYIWAKPFSNDILKLSVGHFDVDNLRGKIGTDTGFENFVLNPMDEDKIFFRFRAKNGGNGPAGYMLSSEPIEGLFIGLLVNGSLWNWNGPKSGTLIADAFRHLQVGFGYDIASIGHIRAQFVGGWFGTVGTKAYGEKLNDKYKRPWFGPEDWAQKDVWNDAEHKFEKELEDWADIGNGLSLDQARMELAFALTAIDNLLIDLGFKFWLPITDDGAKEKSTNGLELGVGARFRADAFQIVAQVHTTFGQYYMRSTSGGTDKHTNGSTLAINLTPTFDLDFATIGASIGTTITGAGKNAKGEHNDYGGTFGLGFGVFAKKGLGSGSVQAGFAYKLPTYYNTKDGLKAGQEYASTNFGVFSIPIILEYAFF